MEGYPNNFARLVTVPSCFVAAMRYRPIKRHRLPKVGSPRCAPRIILVEQTRLARHPNPKAKSDEEFLPIVDPKECLGSSFVFGAWVAKLHYSRLRLDKWYGERVVSMDLPYPRHSTLWPCQLPQIRPRRRRGWIGSLPRHSTKPSCLLVSWSSYSASAPPSWSTRKMTRAGGEKEMLLLEGKKDEGRFT
eukprot:scaffold2353_cov167-Amphora_coffeaeformis.AAC.29